MITYKLIFAATLLVTALSSGLFYSWSVSVNPGLHRLSDEGYLQAMQHLNRAILNPLFFASFMGAVCMLPICTFMIYRHEGMSTAFFLILIATLLYVLGTFGITMAKNVPLNNLLDKNAITRQAFEIPWTKWHNIRTIAAILSLLCSIFAALFK